MQNKKVLKEKLQLLPDKNDLIDKKPKIVKTTKDKIKFFIIVLCIGILVIIFAIIIMLSIKGDYYRLEKNEEKENEKNEPYIEDLLFTEEEHKLFSREVATQTMVLATNNGLPIECTDQVVLFGLGTINTIYGGAGSAAVYKKGTNKPITPITVLEGIENKINENNTKFIYIKNEIGYEVGINNFKEKNLTESDIINFAIKKEGAKRSIAILTISKISGESSDRPHDKSIIGTMLTDSEIETYELLKIYFDHIVVILNVGSVIELNNMEKDKKTSILISFFPGMEAGNAIADILLGEVNPSGHLTDTWASKINDYPTTSTFIESNFFVKYKEGLFLGYRYFEDDEEKQSKVVFPFGHGLTYTKFNIENKCVFNNNKNIFIITSKVTNIGKRKGKQVIQVYIKKPQNYNFIKVQRELVAFNKTKELNVNESQTLIMEFNLSYLASYDDIGVTGYQACYEKKEIMKYM